MSDAALEKLKADKAPLSRGLFFRILFNQFAPRFKAAMDERVAKLEARNAELQTVINQQATALASLEHRAARHAEHLQRIEGRMKKMEGK